MHIREITIKNLKFKNLVLAPMADITSYPFRKILLNHGCGLAVSEMISSKAIYYSNKKTLSMIEIRDDRPIAIQLFGGDVQSMVYAACLCEEKGADMIEINAGCPVKKIVKTSAGISLFSQPQKLGRIVYEISSRIKIPLSVKMRLGIKDPYECINVAKICQDNGASLIHLHMRTMDQMHSGPVNMEVAKILKKEIKIPLIANGGIKTPLDAFKVFEFTQADAISVAQGSISNPFIFDDILCYYKTGIIKKRSVKDKISLLVEYLNISASVYGEKKAVLDSRRLIGLWLSNFEGAKNLRINYMKAQTLSQAIDILKNSVG